MTRLLNLVGNTLAAAVLCTALASCADALTNFKCHRSDFSMVEDNMDRLNANGQTPEVVYDTARNWDRKLVDTCPVEVLQKCTGKTEAKVVGVHGEIDGPVNAFGFHGHTSLDEDGWVHDGFAREKNYRLNYFASVDMNDFKTALACFRDNTN